GKEVGFVSDFPWLGEIPDELKLCQKEDEEKPEIGIYVTTGYLEHPFVHTLYLIPRVITTGLGCKKGTDKETVESVVRRACDELLVPSVAMEQVASIDLKKEEAGILEYCKERKIPFITYTAEELQEVEGTYASSQFVEDVTGVDNVCERAALLGSSKEGKGRLIQRKYAKDGVTVALAMKKWSVNFE
ncbi:MAG: cobalamin biosynthesis protein, partial [Blautia sp.]|nr:cobalamin biosynthesis protein [Blautia sp.]